MPSWRAQRVRASTSRRSWPSTSTRPDGGVVEARHELGERRLARARGADEGDRLPRRDRQVDVVERELRAVVGAVGEGHVVEGDLAADVRELPRVRAVGQLGLLVEQLEDLVQRGHAGLVGRVDLRELADRVEEAVERGQEADEHADGDVALDGLRAADEQDEDRRQRAEELDAREVRGVEVDRRHVRVAVALVQPLEDALVATLLGEGAHDAHAAQRLLQVGRDGARSSRACACRRRRWRCGRPARPGP